MALLAPAAAHATPSGDDGNLLTQPRESFDYLVLDPAKGVDDNLNPPVFGGGVHAAALRSSPDGEHVAYISLDDNRIAVADAADADHEHLLSGTSDAHAVAYSPDGTTIAFTRQDAVWTVPADGSAAPKPLGGTLPGAWSLDWTPNGGDLVVSAHGAGGLNDLYAMNPATGAVAPLTQTATLGEDDLSFAPDGQRLVVAASPASGTINKLDILDADGANRHTLLTEDGAGQPQWSPAGTRIAFITAAGAEGEDVATIKPDGTGRHAVADAAAVGLAWPMKPGTGNRVPAASFTITPVQPYTGGTTTLTSTATDPDGTIASADWDLDGDGQYDDGSGSVAYTSFATAGDHTVGLRVRDDRGAVAVARKTVKVLVGGKPGAAFTVDPANPTVNEPATFTAAPNDDPQAKVLHHEWDFDGDGTFDVDTGTTRTVEHVYAATGPVTARLKVTDAEGDSDTTTVRFEVKDLVHCGVEHVGHLTLDGCLVVKGTRRLAPQGVTVNGFHLGATDRAVPAFDVAQFRAAAVPLDDAPRVLAGSAALPETGASVPVSSACGEALGTSAFALSGFGSSDSEAPFTIGDATTFAGLRAREAGKLQFGNSVAHFDFSGLFPRLLLNWTAEGRGTYAVASTAGCREDHLTVRLGSFLSRVMQFAEVRLERTGTNRWDGSNDMSIKGLPTAVKTTVTAIDGRVRALSFEIGEMPLFPGTTLRGGKVSLRLDRGYEELSGRGTFTTAPRLFNRDFFAVEGSISLGRTGLKIYGVSKVAGFDIGWGSLELDPDSKSLAAEAEADFKLGPVHAEASIAGYVEPLRLVGELEGHGSAGIEGIGKIGADLFLSTRGIAACGHASFGPLGSVDPGFSYRWGDTWPKVFLDSCDFGDLRIVRSARASAAAAQARSVHVAAGQRAVVLVAKGRPGRAPHVSVVGPKGQRITSRKDAKATKTSRFLVIPNKQDGTTNILVMKPAAGTWTVRSRDGRALRAVGSAAARPTPSVKVVRKGKALRWTLRRIPGQSVALVELGSDGARRVLVKGTNSRTGTVRYAPAAGATKVVAEVTQNGLRRATKTVVDLKKKPTKTTKKKK